MKCIGNKCERFSNGNGIGHGWCKELKIRTEIDKECELLKRIQEIRDNLINKCVLFEDILNIDCDDIEFNELINAIP